MKKGPVAVAVITLLVAGAAMARPRAIPPPQGLPMDEAIDRAYEILGNDANSHTAASVACELMYPEGCSAQQVAAAHARIVERFGDTGDSPEEAGTGKAAEVVALIGSLSEEQRSDLRDVLGEYYDDVVTAAYDANEAATLAALDRLRQSAIQMAEEDKTGAMVLYAKLRGIMGDKMPALVELIT